MKKLIFTSMLLLAPTALWAQQAQQPVPITLTVQELEQLQQALNKMPFEYAAPLVQFFGTKERDALLQSKTPTVMPPTDADKHP